MQQARNLYPGTVQHLLKPFDSIKRGLQVLLLWLKHYAQTAIRGPARHQRLDSLGAADSCFDTNALRSQQFGQRNAALLVEIYGCKRRQHLPLRHFFMARLHIRHNPRTSADAERRPRNCSAHSLDGPRHILSLKALVPISIANMKMSRASTRSDSLASRISQLLRRARHTRMLATSPAAIQSTFDQHTNLFGVRWPAYRFFSREACLAPSA